MSTILEKEIKVLDINVEQLVEQLIYLGAVKTCDNVISDTYYDTSDKELEKDNKRLRIRKIGETTLITMKQKLHSKGIRCNTEQELAIEAHTDLLSGYNLIPTRTKKKHRISYSIGATHFDIDCYDGIPPVLEIESTSRKLIFSWIKKLGLEKKTTATFGSRGLFKHYNVFHKYNTIVQ